MAKKRKNPFENPMADAEAFGFGNINIGRALQGIDMQELESLVSSMTDEEGMMAFSMIGHLADSGVTPEAYSMFYNVFQRLRPMIADDDEENVPMLTRKRKPSKKAPASSKTLLIRIQMKGVAKPPMWRELEIPADASFLTLHEAIQILTGLENYHLWQFNEKAYNSYVQIGLPMDNEFGGGIEDITDDASTTPISAYLAKEGDKLEYVYDFGDDWIFVVSVKKVLDKKIEHPVCVAYKCDINAEEDTGGIWSYLEMRTAYNEWGTYSKKKKEEIADRWGYDSASDFYDSLQYKRFDLDEANAALEEL